MTIPSSLSLVQLHSGQMTVFQSPHRFKVVCAGRRWGKSRLFHNADEGCARRVIFNVCSFGYRFDGQVDGIFQLLFRSAHNGVCEDDAAVIPGTRSHNLHALLIFRGKGHHRSTLLPNARQLR